jgi:hypothetical protein
MDSSFEAYKMLKNCETIAYAKKNKDYGVTGIRLWFYLPVSNAACVAKSSWAIRTTPHMGRRITGYTTPQTPDRI